MQNSPSHSNTNMPQEQKPNRLIKETSPYLLQHANNPVDWFPWGDEAFEKAKKENKPVLISIGYSSCHWCHVMEHESFEDEATAKVQNDLFISIKVDREERPDVDQVYMDAVQAMGIQGGWPLNVFVTPEGKPFYGGTYFPPARWRSLLTQLAERYEDDPEKIQNTANELTQFLQTSETTKYGLEDTVVVYDEAHLHKLYRLFEKDFDTKMGGLNRAPKFPLPNNYLFLLRYYNLSKNLELFNQLELTLNRMVWGGIYDQVGGGFARYSTDDQWIVPHFEKMLYDNGQLVSLYAEAYTLTKKARYKTIIRETLEFIEREMTSKEGGFYSALDADSEGEEGKFYVWDWNELESLLGDDLELFADYYNIRPQGNWEHSNILYKTESDSAFLVDKQIDEATFDKKVKEWKKTLLEARSKRIRPGLDDKILTSWNGLMLKGYSDAYRAIGEPHFLDMAIKNTHFILSKVKNGEKLWHTYKAGKATVPGFLDDYALVIEAFISLYQATFDEKWLLEAKTLADYTIKEFYDVEEKLFYYTSESSSSLIARKKELFDNVISSSNSVMANNLYFLGHYFEGSNYLEMSHGMLARVNNMMSKNPQYLANWATLYSYNVHPTAEIAIVGDDYLDVRREIENIYIPNKLLVGSKNGSSALPLLEHREAINDETTIYVCFNKTCKLPVNDVEKALRQIPEAYQ